MNVPTSHWVKFYYVVLSVSCITSNSNIDRTQHFCGNKLSRTLTKLCLKYPSNESNRSRRQITYECCDSPCSLRHLLSNYCLITNKTAVIEFLNRKQSEFPNSIKREREKINLDVSSNEIILDSSVSKEHENTIKVRNNINRCRRNRRKQRKIRKNSLGTLDKISRDSASLLHSDSLTSSYHSPSFQYNSTLGNEKQNNRCTCRKRRAKKHNNRKILQLFNAPPPNIGKIEESQNPFYVFKTMY